MSSLYQLFIRQTENLVPLMKESNFLENGMITPNEFIHAGDFLVSKFPTWSWSGVTDTTKMKNYLPPNKQYLITRNVPCLHRISEVSKMYNEEMIENENWIISNYSKKLDDKNNTKINIDDDIIDMTDDDNINDKIDHKNKNLDDEFIVDEDYDDCCINDNIIRHRTYDISITYDNYYRTPRVWLFGYDEYSIPLNFKQMQQDISSDHLNKTITIEPTPYSNISQLSIHPCKHSNVMKIIIENMKKNKKEIRVDMYMIIFLKFISSIIPTIQYDYTASI